MTPSDTLDATNALPVAQESTSVVAKGTFNPAMFSPSWFLSAGLIGQVEYDDSQVEVIAPELATFRMGWLNFTSTTDSVQFATSAIEERPRLRDAALGTLRTLAYTPMNALGVNTDSHTIVPSPAALHHVGDTLAPKDVWNDFLEFAAVRSVLMWGARSDGWLGRVNVRVEPSAPFPQALYIQVNDHFELERRSSEIVSRDDAFDDSERSAEPTDEKRQIALDILANDWPEIMQRSADAHARIRSIALEV